MRTELDKAMVNKTSVSMKQLKKGLGKIDVDNQVPCAGPSSLLAA